MVVAVVVAVHDQTGRLEGDVVRPGRWSSRPGISSLTTLMVVAWYCAPVLATAPGVQVVAAGTVIQV